MLGDVFRAVVGPSFQSCRVTDHEHSLWKRDTIAIGPTCLISPFSDGAAEKPTAKTAVGRWFGRLRVMIVCPLITSD